MTDGNQTGMIQLSTSIFHGLELTQIRLVRPGSVFRLRLTTTFARIRLSVPAFALNLKKKRSMLATNSSNCIKIF